MKYLLGEKKEQRKKREARELLHGASQSLHAAGAKGLRPVSTHMCTEHEG